MKLAAHELRLLVFCCHEEQRFRRFGAVPRPARPESSALTALIQRLELELAVSSVGQAGGADMPRLQQEMWLTATQAGEFMGMHSRTLRRHANEYGGVKVRGMYEFPLSALIEHLEGQSIG